MTLRTEGGFPASPNPATLGVVDAHIPGTDVNFPGGVAAFAAPLLMWVALQIHERVEKARKGWCWGWNFRDVRGGATIMSDHAGAVAIDYNAPAHPRGVHGTWSDREVAEIRDILAEANADGEVIVWGHDFRTTVDDMHFACRGGVTAVLRAGARLTSEREWFEDMKDADRAAVRDIVDNAIAAALPKIAAGAKDAVAGDLKDPDSPLSKRLRNNVRISIDAELTERGLGNQ